MDKERLDVRLVPLADDDRDQFVLDNQRAFNYGAHEEFGMRDDHLEEDGQVISRETIERALREGDPYRILAGGEVAGGLVVRVHDDHGDLDLLFVDPVAHGRGIGQAAWAAVERRYPQVSVWELDTPYFEKRNVHLYVNRLGFHVTQFINARWPEPLAGDTDTRAHDGEGADEDESLHFRKGRPATTAHVGRPARRNRLPSVQLEPLEGSDRWRIGHDNLAAIRASDAPRAAEEGDAHRIIHDGSIVGELIVTTEGGRGNLALLYVNPTMRGRGIGQATWPLVERMYPQVGLWETVAPYHDKGSIHFFINRLGFEATEFYNAFHPGAFEGDGEWLRLERRVAGDAT